MKIQFVTRNPHNTRLILIITGWSAGPESGNDICFDGWDVAVVHDFSELELDTGFLDQYYTVYLFAWSLGVYASERLLPADRITAAFALNGTIRPVDDRLGIPCNIYNSTADTLTEQNLKKFRLRMAGDRTTFDTMMLGLNANDDNIESLQKQLITVAKDSQRTMLTATRLPWVRAYVSSDDRIFPVENMINAWSNESEVEVVRLRAPHYVPLHRIVETAIANTDTVGKKFSKASLSYDRHAIAQCSVARKLAQMLAARKLVPTWNVLEIGCGTGLLTREYAPLMPDADVTFADIADMPTFGLFRSETYVKADAEQWLESQTRSWDAILSSSAIQWFADIPRFIHECYRHLNPGGIIGISTFLPGNMAELDAMRPSPILYPKAEMLRSVMNRYFKEVEITDETIRIEFLSTRDMLMHLKHTGVAGSAPASGLSISDMSSIRTLTYRPVYIVARK